MIPGCELIGLAGISDRHGLESVIGMARNMHAWVLLIVEVVVELVRGVPVL